MRFDHMCIMVTDMDRALKLWRDVLGFQLLVRTEVPSVGPNAALQMPADLFDDIIKWKGAKSDCALLISSEGALMELQRIQCPPLELVPPENLSSYARNGFQELGLLVSGINGWFDKIRNSGYRTQTEYIWSMGDFGRSFLFYDDDGNLIQLREGPIPIV